MLMSTEMSSIEDIMAKPPISLPTTSLDDELVCPKTVLRSPSPTPDPPLRIFVFDTQRTSSQLFNRQLLSHLRFGSISNPYALAATLGPERIQRKLQNNERAKKAWEAQVASAPPRVSHLTYDHATVKFLTEADRLEQEGKILFVREQAPLVMKHDIILSAMHSQQTIVSKLSNPTCLPDEFLKLITPIIFIRHPARVIPAWFREANSQNGCYNIDDDDLTLWTSVRWSRILFDYLRGSGHYKRGRIPRPSSATQPSDSLRPTLSRVQSSPATPQRPELWRNDSSFSNYQLELPEVACWPMVIDAVDAMNDTHAILATVCRLLGLDGDGMQNSWSVNTKFERARNLVKKTSENLMKAFSDRLQHANRKEIQSEWNIDLDAEQAAWTKEFGRDVAQSLRRKVEEELPHYNYLKNFKLCVRPTPTEMSSKERNVFGVPLEPRWSFAAPLSSVWMDRSKSSESLMSEIRRASSLGQVPAGIMC